MAANDNNCSSPDAVILAWYPRDVQETAAAALADSRVVPPDTVDLARLGAYGKHRGNVARDLARHCRNKYALVAALDFYYVDAPFIKPNDLGVEFRRCPMLLPHDLFAALYEHARPQWDQIFGMPEDRVAYWAQQAGNPWFEDHPDKDRSLQTKNKDKETACYSQKPKIVCA